MTHIIKEALIDRKTTKGRSSEFWNKYEYEYPITGSLAEPTAPNVGTEKEEDFRSLLTFLDFQNDRHAPPDCSVKYDQNVTSRVLRNM